MQARAESGVLIDVSHIPGQVVVVKALNTLTADASHEDTVTVVNGHDARAKSRPNSQATLSC